MTQPIRYAVDLSDRVQHLVRVSVTVPADLAPAGRLVFSAWTPGSYVVRDYARHVQTAQASDADGRAVALFREGIAAWRLPDRLEGPATVVFELYANDLTVRTNHVDDHHALLIPAATFPYLEGGEARQHRVHLPPSPADHEVFSLLPAGDEPDTYVAVDRDHLIDSAFEVGRFPTIDFEVRQVPHRFVWAGHGGAVDLARVAREVTAIAEAAIDLMGGVLPIERYTFLAVGWDQGGGGLEHRDGAVLQVPVRTFQDEQMVARLQSLIAHEYFHLWNVKRLVPADLVRPNFDQPTYSESLWVAEGWTSYYDEILPTRAGLWQASQLLDSLARSFTRTRDTPGVDRQSLRQASYEAWIKHYRRDENAPNAMTDYYGHGALVAWELDLRLRYAGVEDGLDQVLRSLWARHAGSAAGYTEQDVLDAVAHHGGARLAALAETRVAVPGPPDLDEIVEVVGLRWDVAPDPTPPSLGLTTDATSGAGVGIAAVFRGGPAWSAGLTGGDRLIAVDGATVTPATFDAIVSAHASGATVPMTVMRGPRLLTLPTTLATPTPAARLVPVDAPDEAQRAAFQRWTGQPLPSADPAVAPAAAVRN